MKISYLSVTLHATRTTITVKIFFIAALLNIPIINDPFEAFELHRKVMYNWNKRTKADNYSTTLLVFSIFTQAAVLLSHCFFEASAMSILSRESLVSNSGQQLVWPNCDTQARYGKEGTGRQGTGIHAPCDRPTAPVHVFECVYGLKNNT